MERLWGLSFTSMFPVPGNKLSMFFDSEEKAREIFDRHATLMEIKPDDAMPPLVFDDLIGHHCLRASAFPHCMVSEIGPNDLMTMEVNKKIEASQRAAGFTKSVGFEAGKEAN